MPPVKNGNATSAKKRMSGMDDSCPKIEAKLKESFEKNKDNPQRIFEEAVCATPEEIWEMAEALQVDNLALKQ